MKEEPTARETQHHPDALTPGTVLRERYRIRQIVGRGGFGSVYQAEDLRLGSRLVAVKEMRQRGQTTREAQQAAEAFQREANLLAGLQHPGLPATYDYFEEAERWYLVMEFIAGETLEARLEKTPGGHLPVAEVLRISLHLCDVLSYLHEHEPPIIFRDLKPANIMIDAGNMLYLIDFGIARHFKAGKSKDTVLFGSPGYAAPEQYGKAQTTPQSDIYSLGTTLHQLLSGQDPTLHPFLFAPLDLPDLPELGSLILHMVHHDASKRPARAAAVAQQLRDIAKKYASLQTTNATMLTETGVMMATVPCPVCSRQHYYQLRLSFQNVLCLQNRQPFTVLLARARMIASDPGPHDENSRTYHLQVMLPDGLAPLIEFQSRNTDFEAHVGNVMIVVYHVGQVKIVMNTTNSHTLYVN